MAFIMHIITELSVLYALHRLKKFINPKICI